MWEGEPGKKVLHASPRQRLRPEGWGAVRLGPQHAVGRAMACSLDPRKLRGLKLVGPSSQPSPTLAGCLDSHWLVEGLFVYQDKEEIEKFLRG